MTTTNLPELAYGSVERFEKTLTAAAARPGGQLWPYAIGTIEGILSDLHSSDEYKVRLVRNALVALGHVADAPTGLDYSRESDDPTPVSPARVPLHVGDVESQIADDGTHLAEPGTGSIVNRELVDEPVTRYFSFGHGQTDPDTGEDLNGKYVTVIAPTGEQCRDAMFASRYGREWAFEYVPGTPSAAVWIPQWIEHDRIVVRPGEVEGGCE